MTISNCAAGTYQYDQSASERRDPGLFAPLTGDEQRIVRYYLTGGWHMIPAVHGHGHGLWEEIYGLLTDLHLAWVIERSDAGAVAAASARGQVTA